MTIAAGALIPRQHLRGDCLWSQTPLADELEQVPPISVDRNAKSNPAARELASTASTALAPDHWASLSAGVAEREEADPLGSHGEGDAASVEPNGP